MVVWLLSDIPTPIVRTDVIAIAIVAAIGGVVVADAVVERLVLVAVRGSAIG